MSTTILSSTFLLTLLLAVGLFFFIRASVKDRTEQVRLIAQQPEASLFSQLQQYFQTRAYRVTALDAEKNQVTFQGFVRPSWFLAIFLTLLALCGILCLVLVLSQLFPQAGGIFLVLLLLAPAAGIFYWQKAARPEIVSLKVEAVVGEGNDTQSILTVTAHRDELASLQQALQLKTCE